MELQQPISFTLAQYRGGIDRELGNWEIRKMGNYEIGKWEMDVAAGFSLRSRSRPMYRGEVRRTINNT